MTDFLYTIIYIDPLATRLSKYPIPLNIDLLADNCVSILRNTYFKNHFVVTDSFMWEKIKMIQLHGPLLVRFVNSPFGLDVLDGPTLVVSAVILHVIPDDLDTVAVLGIVDLHGVLSVVLVGNPVAVDRPILRP